MHICAPFLHENSHVQTVYTPMISKLTTVRKINAHPATISLSAHLDT
ncbi:hypothetical protein EMIT0210MI2_12699 [Priestia megaterium]